MKKMRVWAYSMIALSMMCATMSEAQISKGTILLGGAFDLSAGSTESKEYYSPLVKTKQSNYSLAPSVGFFVSDKICVGIGIPLAYSRVKLSNLASVYPTDPIASQTSQFRYGVNPFVRYYIGFTEKFYGYIHAGGSFSFSKRKDKYTDYNGFEYSQEHPAYDYSAGAGFGLSYFVTSKLAVETSLLSIGYSGSYTKQNPTYTNYVKSDGFSIRYLGSALNIGISYYLK